MREQSRPHLLIIDDHPGMAKVLVEMVEHAGFRASSASSGREGIAAFNEARSAGVPVSVVITDFSMKDLDGLAVAAAVKAASPTTAVVLLTAHAVDEHDHMPENVDALLGKPPSVEQLRSTLSRLIGTPDAERL